MDSAGCFTFTDADHSGLQVKVKVTQSCVTLCNSMGYVQSMEFSRPEYWSG